MTTASVLAFPSVPAAVAYLALGGIMSLGSAAGSTAVGPTVPTSGCAVCSAACPCCSWSGREVEAVIV